MTDITELAQSLKAAANTTADAIDRLKAFPGDELIDLSQHEGEQVDIDITTLNEWYELSSPANILALVEALEKAQAQSSKWLEAYHKAVSIGARYEERIAELESRTVTAAAADVLAERQRQVTAEGWSPKHDDQYKNTELAFAASCYAFHSAAASWDLEDDGIPYDSHPIPKQWPWDPSWWRPTDARRDLVKAGALILAEIERLDRAAGIKWEAE